MLPCLTIREDVREQVNIRKICNGKCSDFVGAYCENQKLLLQVEISRKIGVSRVYLCLENADSGIKERIQLAFISTDYSKDIYSVTLDFSNLCPDGDGLFYWKTELCIEKDSFFSDSINNVDYVLSDKSDSKPFRLLVYNKDFSTPKWATNAVMYQIFVDRFCKGSVEVEKRCDCKINGDWYEGVPEFPEKNGDPFENNMFFGGTIWGVAEKLDYLQSLGVNVIYLCPIFKAFSNHKYDTGDYETVDEMFGGDEAFYELIKQANARNIKIILDGVFNHTGDDSKYFNRYSRYNFVGAYQSQESEYYDWYKFYEFPNKYESWWGIEILPRLMGDNEKVKEYFLSQDGIVRKWLRRGAYGWRLDVADELSEEFLEGLYSSAKTEKEDCLVIGEVWENAADKISYGKIRKYFRGKQLDSVMNYPVKDAIIDFVKNGDAEKFYDSVTDIYSSYPEFCSSVLMNLVGSHDTARILTVLGGENPEGKMNRELSALKMSDSRLENAIKLLKIASVLQFTLPGIPMIYYGDEAGLEGYSDPFCRKTFPWGRENKELTEHYKKLCSIKRAQESLHGADISFLIHSDGFVVFERGNITVLVNVGESEKKYELCKEHTDLYNGDVLVGEITILPKSARILRRSFDV